MLKWGGRSHGASLPSSLTLRRDKPFGKLLSVLIETGRTGEKMDWGLIVDVVAISHLQHTERRGSRDA